MSIYKEKKMLTKSLAKYLTEKSKTNQQINLKRSFEFIDLKCFNEKIFRNRLHFKYIPK